MTRYYQAPERNGPWKEISKREFLLAAKLSKWRAQQVFDFVADGEPVRIGAHWYRAEVEPPQEQEGLFS